MVPRPGGLVKDFKTTNVILEEEREGTEVGVGADATTTICYIAWCRRVMMRPAKLNA